MGLVREEQALKKLGKHLSAFQDLVQGGWNDLVSMFERYPDLRTVFCPATRASVVHDFQIERASKYADSVRGVRVQDLNGMKLLIVDNQFAVRVKKLDDRLMPSNHLTDQVLDFRRQHQLPGFPKTHNLDLGYVLNKAQTAIEQICLVCPNGPLRNYWDRDLLDTDAPRQGKILELFEHRKPQSGAEEDDSIVVRPKQDKSGTAKEKEGDDEKN